MMKKILLLAFVFLLLLGACSAPAGEQNGAAVSEEERVIEVYRAPT